MLCYMEVSLQYFPSDWAKNVVEAVDFILLNLRCLQCRPSAQFCIPDLCSVGVNAYFKRCLSHASDICILVKTLFLYFT